MSNSEIFISPGNWGMNFLLSVFGSNASSLDPGLYSLGTIFIALFAWLWIIKILIAIIKRVTGFDSHRGRY